MCGRPTSEGNHGTCVERLHAANRSYSTMFAAAGERDRALDKAAARIMRGLLLASAVVFAGAGPVRRVTG